MVEAGSEVLATCHLCGEELTPPRVLRPDGRVTHLACQRTQDEGAMRFFEMCAALVEQDRAREAEQAAARTRRRRGSDCQYQRVVASRPSVDPTRLDEWLQLRASREMGTRLTSPETRVMVQALMLEDHPAVRQGRVTMTIPDEPAFSPEQPVPLVSARHF